MQVELPQLCLFQGEREYARPRELTKTLLKSDENLIPKFLEALADTNQQHVARILAPEGMITDTSAMLHTCYVILGAYFI